ncbi:SAM-dependent methyltransferase [Nonomuraea sp. NPDC050536]|uniref:SAM-dependent methyltransferase n=1 Tax=Nonomuraea sp. NPDC050536 TaxID=3364366 RepID=UPI0037C589D0
MAEDERAPAGIDPTVPSVARMYDYYLGGKDNFASDREAAQKIIELVPSITDIAKDNREFLIRVVRTLAANGIRQFVDIGTGLPTQQNVHQVALDAAPDARIVYVDKDPIVLVHARALLMDNPRTIVINADMRDPKGIVEHPELRSHIDFSRPVAMLLFAILHFVPDQDEAASIVTALRGPLASGSYLALSHSYAGSLTQDTIQRGQSVYRTATPGSITPRTQDQVGSLFAGLTMEPPGVVPVQAWRPDWHDVRPDFTLPGLLGGVARVP